MADICNLVSFNIVTLRDLAVVLPAWTGWLLAVLWGLLLGSFATVAVDRWPAMIEGRMPATALWYPGSRCPACSRPLTALQRTPLLGWIILRGRCACGCGRIGWRDPVLELGGVLAMVLVMAIDPGPVDHVLAMMLVASFLYLLGAIDATSGYLPDVLTLGLLWLGLIYSLAVPCGALGVTADTAILGAAGGWLVMAAVAGGARLVIGREALAQGDWKLVAAVGAWGGVDAVILVILFGAMIGMVLSPLLARFRMPGDGGPDAGIPLGPGLALAAMPIIALGLSPSVLFGGY